MSLTISTRAMLFGAICACFINVAQATPMYSDMSLTSEVRSDTESDIDSQSVSAFAPLTMSVASSASVPGVSMSSYGHATWAADGNTGSVRLGHKHSILNGGDVLRNGTSPVWQYSFFSDFDGTLSLTYDVVGYGDLFGLGGWNIIWTGQGGGAELYNSFDPSNRGTFTRDVVANNFYAIGLTSSSHLGASHRLVGSVEGAFDFAMTKADSSDIPEPGNLALFGVALAGLLTATRLKAAAAITR